MRRLLSSVVACLFLAGPAAAFAQDPADLNSGTTGPTSQTVVKKKTPRLRPQSRPTRIVVSPESAARLIHQRAMSQARMRRARIEVRHWSGVSLLRPTVGDPSPLFAADGSLIGASPWWWNTASSRVRVHW